MMTIICRRWMPYTHQTHWNGSLYILSATTVARRHCSTVLSMLILSLSLSLIALLFLLNVGGTRVYPATVNWKRWITSKVPSRKWIRRLASSSMLQIYIYSMVCKWIRRYRKIKWAHFAYDNNNINDMHILKDGESEGRGRGEAWMWRHIYT